jgi:hypothetical protein
MESPMSFVSQKRKEHMSGTIKAIERHMILPVRLGPRSTIPPVRLGLQNRKRKLVAEWQRGAEILGHAQQKLRLAFAPAHSPAFATLGH